MKYVIELDFDPSPKVFDSAEEAMNAAEQYLRDDADEGMNIVWRQDDNVPYEREKVIAQLNEEGEISLAVVGISGPPINGIVQETSGLTLIVATEDHYRKSVAEATAELNQLAQEMADDKQDNVSISVEGRTKTFKPKKKK